MTEHHSEEQTDRACAELHRRAERRHWTFEKIGSSIALFLAGVAAMGAIASAFAAYWAYQEAARTAKAAVAANELTQKNNVLSQRAFVSVTYKGQWVSATNENKPRALNFLFSEINSGGTPTKEFHSFMRCAPAADDMSEPWTLLHEGQPSPFKDTGNFIGAHPSEDTGCAFDFDRVEQIRDEKSFGFVLIAISYRDRLDQTVLHKTQKALRLWQVAVTPTPIPNAMPGVTAGLVSVGAHNCADEECP